MASLDLKVLRKKKLDKELNLKVYKNEASERIFVEFSSKDGRLILQKNFQDTYLGRKQVEEFESKIKNIDDLKTYLRVK